MESYGVFAVATHAPQTPPPSPTPGVDIVDINLDTVVTNTTQNAIVGAQQRLYAVPSQPTDPISNCDWTIAGTTVGSYAPTPTSASPSPEPTTGVMGVTFYWIGNGSGRARQTP